MSVDKQLKPSAVVLECINGSHEPFYSSPILVYGTFEFIYGDRESIYGALEYAYKIQSLLERPSSLLQDFLITNLLCRSRSKLTQPLPHKQIIQVCSEYAIGIKRTVKY